MFKKLLATAVAVLMLAGCNERGEIDKQALGGITGAVGGAVIGSNVGKGKGNIAAIAAGTLLGAAIGNDIGRSLDRADIQYHDRAGQSALEHNKVGATSSWKNPDTGASGTFTPVKTYEKAGSYCREFNQTIKIGDKVEKGYGTACRQPDGSWKIIN